MSVSVVFLTIAYLLGFGLLGYGCWGLWRSTRAASWPTTPGALTRAELYVDNSGDSTTYQVKVAYRYTVKGVTYRGSRLAFGYAGDSGRATHEALHKKLRAVNHVSVRYDPSDPSVSCLACGPHRSVLIVLAFGATWVLLVTLAAVLFWTDLSPDPVLLDNLEVH